MDTSWLIFFAAIGVLIIGIGIILIVQLTWLGSLLREQVEEAARARRTPPGGTPAPAPDLGARKQNAKDQKKLFKEFINQRPEILDEPKKTQFDEFRQWREARGL